MNKIRNILLSVIFNRVEYNKVTLSSPVHITGQAKVTDRKGTLITQKQSQHFQ